MMKTKNEKMVALPIHAQSDGIRHLPISTTDFLRHGKSYYLDELLNGAIVQKPLNPYILYATGVSAPILTVNEAGIAVNVSKTTNLILEVGLFSGFQQQRCAANRPSKIELPIPNGKYWVNITQIVHIKKNKQGVDVLMVWKECIYVDRPLGEFIDLLASYHIVQVSPTQLVNLGGVQLSIAYNKCVLTLPTGDKIFVEDKFRTDVIHRFEMLQLRDIENGRHEPQNKSEIVQNEQNNKSSRSKIHLVITPNCSSSTGL